MNLNKKLLEKFRDSSSSILAVTKYLDKDETFEVFEELDENYFEIFAGIGENRLEKLEEKNLPKENTHFIGNIQTKQIKKILDFAGTIHSVDNVKHILKMDEICEKKGIWVKIFLQINVDESKDSGIKPEEIPHFLEVLSDLENVSLIGFSAMGKEKFTREEKEKEFDLLLNLKEKYIPNGFISAGTSVDYEIALEKGIDIVRIGRSLYESSK